MTQAATTVGSVALVPAVFAVALPSLAEVRGAADTRGHLAHSVTVATLTAGAMVIAVGHVTDDRTAVALGLATVAGYALAYRAAVRA